MTCLGHRRHGLHQPDERSNERDGFLAEATERKLLAVFVKRCLNYYIDGGYTVDIRWI